MTQHPTKTDNSYLAMKVKLRMDNLPAKKAIRVLDCFAGEGLIWREIQRQAGSKSFTVLSIDWGKRKDSRLALSGDNRKFLASIDLKEFDIIDLDAYGVPYAQLKMILARDIHPGTIVFGTFLQSVMGALPRGMLHDLGYPPQMIKKVPKIFNRHGQDKLLAWLGNNGVQRIKLYATDNRRKTYFAFSIQKKGAK